MRKPLLIGLCMSLAGCLGSEIQTGRGTKDNTAMAQAVGASMTKSPEEPASTVALHETTRSDCYTVVLFTEVSAQKPAPKVPDTYRQFHGRWTNGAWNGVWCHDLLVSKVDASGRVELVDMHAPYEPWNQPATAFRRVGRIDDQGILRFSRGGTKVSYRIEDGKLVGTRRGGGLGRLEARLVRPGTVATSVPQSIRLSEK